MKATKQASIPEQPVRSWRGGIPLQSLYTAGLGGQVFFKALKERGEIVGTRCRDCKQVYVPARAFCERCFAELTEQVKVKPEGTLTSFTFSYFDRDGKRMEAPDVLGLVQLEGATTVMLNRLLKVCEPSKISIGARVRVVIRPQARRTGSILDIEGFELI
ncbi:MAG TPA: Zn-ribbon domain-containing OB-fold protein [Candidatus Xenobia bacterium]|nr:Zn-ribbon domain-containing OB-fold protein [Candidatus Xenobia bacterium]